MKTLKVLVIDDEKLIRWSFEKKLKSGKYKVFTSATGEEGLEIFKQEQPHIVFLDNRLPKMQGLEVLQKIKTINEEALVVFMTAYETVEIAVNAIKFGAYDYINKPFTFEEIDIILEKISEKYNRDIEIQLLR